MKIEKLAMLVIFTGLVQLITSFAYISIPAKILVLLYIGHYIRKNTTLDIVKIGAYGGAIGFLSTGLSSIINGILVAFSGGNVIDITLEIMLITIVFGGAWAIGGIILAIIGAMIGGYQTSKPTSKGYFVVIRGPLGVGKSTIAVNLAEILKGRYISIDKTLEQMGLDKVEGESIPAKNFINAQEEVMPVIKDSLERGEPVIIDGCFYHAEQIEHLANNLDYKNYVFSLKSDLDVCIERDKKRGDSHGEDAAKAVYELVSRLDIGTVIENKNIEQTLKKIQEEIFNTKKDTDTFLLKIKKDMEK